MEEKEMLLVTSKMKKTIKALGLHCAGDVAEALSLQLHKVIEDAVENTKKAKRKTLMVCDL